MFGGGRAPTVAGFLFTISPYHLNQYYNSFMWGEFASLSVLPFAFLFVLRVCTFGGLANLAGLTFSLAAIILSNIPQAVISVPCLAIFALACIERDGAARQIASMLAAGILAALITMFYWVRVIAEMEWIQISLPNTDPAYDYRNHFLFNSLEFDTQGAWFGSVILVLLLSAVGAALISSGRIRSLHCDRRVIGVIAVLTFSLAMMLPVSNIVWGNVELLQRIQFPWRFLSPASLMVSLLVGFAAADPGKIPERATRSCALVVAGILLIFATFSAKQVVLGADSIDPNSFNCAAVATGSALGLPHWWPVWSSKDTFVTADPVSAEGRAVEIFTQTPTSLDFSVSSGSPTTIRISKLFYPHWKVSVNGRPDNARSLDGALALDVGPEASRVRVAFVEPWYTTPSRYVSVITALGIFAMFVFCQIRRARSYE